MHYPYSYLRSEMVGSGDPRWIGKLCSQGKTLGANITENHVVFATATTGAAAAKRLFTVTGTVALTIVAVCKVLLDPAVGGATIEVGFVGDTACIIAQSTAADIDADEVWAAAGPATQHVITSDTIPPWYIVNAKHPGYKIATQAVATGEIKFYCLWEPISADGYVESAGSNATA